MNPDNRLTDALMNLHRPVDRGRVMRCCEGCEAVNGEFHEDCCHEWPCPTVEAITAVAGTTHKLILVPADSTRRAAPGEAGTPPEGEWVWLASREDWDVGPFLVAGDAC